MHYCLLLITEDIPSDDDILRILSPYYCENVYNNKNDNGRIDYPVFTFDWYQIGGRYNGTLKLKIDSYDEKYRWGYIYHGGRNKKVFHSYLINKMKARTGRIFFEEDYYNSMGYRDGFLYVDGAYVSDLINFDDVGSYICIDKDGNAIARESWNGENFIKDENFEEKLKEIKKNSIDCFATIIDIHD